ncbi:MAG: hypothetical protein WAM09_17885, partial [Anaerolineales bacterium]
GINRLHYFGKIVLADKMSSTRNNIQTMKKFRGWISILILITFIITPSQPVHAAIQYLATVTAPTDTTTQPPTETPGTPALTFTPSTTPSDTSTTTLMPLPAITLIFPASTNTSTVTITPVPVSITETPRPSGGDELFTQSPRVRLLTIMLVVLWMFLAGFVIIYIRQFR